MRNHPYAGYSASGGRFPGPLKWQNIKDGNCPKCGRHLVFNVMTDGGGARCSGMDRVPTCNFRIGQEKLDNILKNDRGNRS